MPDPRAQWFIINERQDRWWLYGHDRKPLYGATDAPPLPTEPQRERASYVRRLAFRLRMIIRPNDRRSSRSDWKPSGRIGGDATGQRPG